MPFRFCEMHLTHREDLDKVVKLRHNDVRATTKFLSIYTKGVPKSKIINMANNYKFTN